MPHKKGMSWEAFNPLNIISIYNAVKDVLMQYEIPVYYYSIGEPADDCVCLEYKEGKWIVYEKSRGEIIHSRSFNNPYAAGCSLFGSVAIGEVKLDLMENLLRYKIARIENPLLYTRPDGMTKFQEQDIYELDFWISQARQKAIEIEEMLRISGFIKDNKEIAGACLIKEYYNAVEDVLKQNEIPVYYYSIGEPADDCVCLEYKDGKWIVYENSRGEVIHSKSFDNAYDAGCSLFGSVAIGEAKVASMRLILESKMSDSVRIAQLREREIKLQEEITKLLGLVAEIDNNHTNLKINGSFVHYIERRGHQSRVPYYWTNENASNFNNTAFETEKNLSTYDSLHKALRKRQEEYINQLNSFVFLQGEDTDYIIPSDGQRIKMDKTNTQVPTREQTEELKNTKQEKGNSKKGTNRNKKTASRIKKTDIK